MCWLLEERSSHPCWVPLQGMQGRSTAVGLALRAAQNAWSVPPLKRSGLGCSQVSIRMQPLGTSLLRVPAPGCSRGWPLPFQQLLVSNVNCPSPPGELSQAPPGCGGSSACPGRGCERRRSMSASGKVSAEHLPRPPRRLCPAPATIPAHRPSPASTCAFVCLFSLDCLFPPLSCFSPMGSSSRAGVLPPPPLPQPCSGAPSAQSLPPS